MDLYEQIAKDRIEAALREADLRRALRSGRARRPARVRLRNVLARLRRWVFDHGSSRSERKTAEC
jgi:hypothetical protein